MTGLDVARRPDGEPITITWEQVSAINHAVRVWRQVAIEFGGERYEYLKDGPPRTVDMEKSCLLGRLLTTGKPPLPTPPPLYLAGPWYSLVEEGRAYFSSLFPAHPYHGDGYLSFGGSKWPIADRHGDTLLLTQERLPGESWRFRRLDRGEPTKQVGTHLDSLTGRYEPVMADLILERMA